MGSGQQSMMNTGIGFHSELIVDPIDIVISWVDGSDDKRAEALLQSRETQNSVRGSMTASRWEDKDELRFCLRSIEQYAPWVRKIHLVTSFGQRPSWINLDHPKLHIVDDDEILGTCCIPTFSSHAIESNLHRIHGLSNKFIYMCDDYFFNKPVMPEDFFDGEKICVFECSAGSPRGVAVRSDGYKTGIKNANRLLDKVFGFKRRGMLKHVAYPLTRRIYRDCWSIFEEALDDTSREKFRSINDVCPSSFLMPHYALHSGQGVARDVKIAGRKKIESGEKDFLLGHINFGTKRDVQRLFKKIFPRHCSFESVVKHETPWWRALAWLKLAT